jgi:capsular polysaccharide biosynthesis protein
VVDAVYCPTSRTWYELSTNLPILELLQPSHDFSGFYAGSQPQKEIDTYRLLEDAIEIDAESLYLPATLHYGHFLTQSAAYLHPLAALPGSLCDHSITCLMSGHLTAGFQSIIEAGSCAPLKYYQIDSQPIHARRLIVSQCSWIEWHYANKVHSNLFSNATKNILGLIDDVILPSHFKHEPKKLYMSRSRLTDGLRFSVNELELERKLESLGFITVHPQELSLKELMQILQSADILVGSMGSAMHNLLFRLPSKPITVVNIAHFLPPYNFAMIEAVSGLTNSHYLRASEELKDAEGINRLYFDVPKILECVHSLIAQL